jgi:hypothetical protein
VATYGLAVILAHGFPLCVLRGDSATVSLVLVGVAFGTFTVVATAGRAPRRSALVGLPQAPRPEVEQSALTGGALL